MTPPPSASLEPSLGPSREPSLESNLEPCAAAGSEAEGCLSPANHAVQDFGWTLNTLLRAYLGGARQAVASLPGGPRGYQVLALAAGDAGRNQATIAVRLGIDRTVMTYLLDDLERDGLVERTPDPADRRARLITLTTRGRSVLEKLSASIGEVERHVLAGLSDDEAAAVRGMLSRAALAVDVDGQSGPQHALGDQPC